MIHSKALANFDRKNHLTFSRFQGNIQIETLPEHRRLPCSGSVFTTTFHPTDVFGANGNSGDKSAKEHLISSRKRQKASEMPQKKVIGAFWDFDVAGSNPVTPTR